MRIGVHNECRDGVINGEFNSTALQGFLLNNTIPYRRWSWDITFSGRSPECPNLPVYQPGSNNGSCSSPSSTVPIPRAAHNPPVGSDKEKSMTSQSSLVSIGEGLTALPRRLFEKIGLMNILTLQTYPMQGESQGLSYIIWMDNSF